MHTQLTPSHMFSPPPWFRLRIACRCLAMSWRESEHLQPLVVAAAILIVMFAPIVWVVWEIW